MALQWLEKTVLMTSAIWALFCFAVMEAQVTAGTSSTEVLKLDTLFYHRSCPALEQVVASTMARYLQQDITAGAPLVRMFFHDCAVNVSFSLRPR